MDWLAENRLLALLAVITAGWILGRVRVGGLALGSSGVVFTALAAGHFGFETPAAAGVFGLVLFVYCVGLGAGPGFFRAFLSQGRIYAQLAGTMTALSACAAAILVLVFKLPVDLTVGFFAGALTSTPGLASAIESLPPDSRAAVGYGLAYPLGLVTIVLFVQLAPRLAGINLRLLGAQLDARRRAGHRITRRLVEVVNPTIEGMARDELDFLHRANCQILRVLQDKRLRPIDANFRLAVGQQVLVIGREARLRSVIPMLGREVPFTDQVIDYERERREIVVSSSEVVGKKVFDLRTLPDFGVTIARVQRYDHEFVPTPSDVIEYGDSLAVIGEPGNLDRFAAFAGHRSRTFDETDLISVGLGLIGGVLAGMVGIEFVGTTFSLGMAGGPLLVALLVSSFGRIGPVRGQIPRASRLLLQDFGLALFLAAAGTGAGAELAPTVREYGFALLPAAAALAVTPVAAGWFVGRVILKLDWPELLGAICGGLTSTPGLGAIAAQTDADAPIISYAAAYPVGLILMTILARMLASL